MKTKLIIGLISFILLGCNKTNDEVIEQQVENELLTLKEKYDITYKKVENTAKTENAISVADLKRFFTSLEIQTDSNKLLSRVLLPNIKGAIDVHSLAYVDDKIDNFQCWTTFTIDQRQIDVYAYIALDDDYWPHFVNYSVKFYNVTCPTSIVEAAGNNIYTLFCIRSQALFELFDESTNSLFMVLWEFNIVCQYFYGALAADMYLTTYNYEEVRKQHF